MRLLTPYLANKHDCNVDSKCQWLNLTRTWRQLPFRAIIELKESNLSQSWYNNHYSMLAGHIRLWCSMFWNTIGPAAPSVIITIVLVDYTQCTHRHRIGQCDNEMIQMLRKWLWQCLIERLEIARRLGVQAPLSGAWLGPVQESVGLTLVCRVWSISN